MRQQGQKTRYPGVYRVNDNSYRVRAVGTDPRTGKKKAVEKLYEGVSAQQAARLRTDLIEEIVAAMRVATKQRVSDFARSWIASKAVSVDATTASTYADALEQHVLPVLGDYWYDALAKVDVQKWVDDCFSAIWKTPSGKKKRYSRNSVHGWFRVFRTMTRDAVDALHLPTDPCVRIRFPQEELGEGSNALEPEELLRFLAEMRARYPHHHAMVTLLAFTGLRFCHASALKWDDWDEDKAVLHVRRKHVRGEIAPVWCQEARAQRDPGRARARGGSSRAPGAPGGREGAGVRAGVDVPIGRRDAADAEHDGPGVGEVPRCRKGEAPLHRARPPVHVHRPDPAVEGRRGGAAGADRHVTQEMQQHYSNVGTEEKRAAIAGALQLLADARAGQSVNFGVNRGGSEEVSVT